MKSLIITVAGLSRRFNEGTNNDVLKCLYYENSPDNSLISLQIRKLYCCVDEIIVVGGYKFEDLKRFISIEIGDIEHKVKLVYNEHYYDYGSGYSLLMGLEYVSKEADEVIFIEGDLFFDADSIRGIVLSQKDVISVNNQPILSNKSVVLYFDINSFPHYVYDTGHSSLEIQEPFTSIYNSAQMWKFIDLARLRKICSLLTDEQMRGTNLEIIQKYFGVLRCSQLDIVGIRLWYNCNTVADYHEAVNAFNI